MSNDLKEIELLFDSFEFLCISMIIYRRFLPSSIVNHGYSRKISYFEDLRMSWCCPLVGGLGVSHCCPPVG